MPAKGHKRTFAQIIQSARWEIGNTARCLAFCHVRVLIEINGARRHRLLFHDRKPIGYATDCETITLRAFRIGAATRCAFSPMSVTSHAKNMTIAESRLAQCSLLYQKQTFANMRSKPN